MLDLTGSCMSGENAVDFLELLPDNIPNFPERAVWKGI